MSENVVLNVQGMSCMHCVMSIKKGVGELQGIENVDVSLQEGKVAVTFDPNSTNIDEIKEAIEDVGYDVVD